jgi:hypothetical protein
MRLVGRECNLEMNKFEKSRRFVGIGKSGIVREKVELVERGCEGESRSRVWRSWK